MVNPHHSYAPYIYRSQAKSGTCSFYAYATVYVIKKNKRVTLAIKAVQQQNTLVAIITYLLALIEPLNLQIVHIVFRPRVVLCTSD
jgi:putative transposase